MPNFDINVFQSQNLMSPIHRFNFTILFLGSRLLPGRGRSRSVCRPQERQDPQGAAFQRRRRPFRVGLRPGGRRRL